MTVVSGGTCQDGSANGFDDTHISVVSLWRGLYPNGTLLESEDLNGATSITFDDFNEVLVPASSTQPMYITVDLVDDTSNNGSCISAEISSIDAEDDENDVVPFVIFPTSYVPNELNIL